jgi:uncharacterized membrane protein
MATWKRADAAATPRTHAELETLLQPSARRTGRALEAAVWSHLGLLAVALGFALANLGLYRGNATMLAVELGVASAALAGLAFGAWLIARSRAIARANLPLLETIERRLALHGRWFELWAFAAAVTPWLLSLAINTRIDCADGAYRVNQPLTFVAVSLCMVAFCWVMVRVSLAPTVSELRAVLHDLRAQALDETPAIEGVRRRSRTWIVLGVVLLVLGVIAGVRTWLGAA